MSGLIGRKIGMTSIFDENGKNIPCTVMKLVLVLLPKSEPLVLTGTSVATGSMTKKTFHKAFRSL
jgi:ribosomal protein L3